MVNGMTVTVVIHDPLCATMVSLYAVRINKGPTAHILERLFQLLCPVRPLLCLFLCICRYSKS